MTWTPFAILAMSLYLFFHYHFHHWDCYSLTCHIMYDIFGICHYLKIPSPPPLLLSDLPCQRWSLHHHYPHHHHHHHCHGKGGGEQPGCFLGLDTAAVALLRLENSPSMSSIHLKFCPSITSIHVKVSYLPQVELAWQSWGHNTVVNPRMEGMAQMRVPASCCKG